MLPFEKSVIIIPTFNEIENIKTMIERIFTLYPDVSLLIVDDGSPDGTAKVVKEITATVKKLFLIERAGKQGLGTAYVCGMKWALARDYQFIFEMDCDFSHDPVEIKNLLQAAQTNDLAIGSRYIGGIRIINWPIHRLLLSYFASWYVRLITGMPVSDATGGFKCFSRKALTALDLDKVRANGYSFQIELNFKVFTQGLKIKEIPIIFYERREGKSKMNFSIVREAVFSVFFLKFKKIFRVL